MSTNAGQYGKERGEVSTGSETRPFKTWLLLTNLAWTLPPMYTLTSISNEVPGFPKPVMAVIKLLSHPKFLWIQGCDFLQCNCSSSCSHPPLQKHSAPHTVKMPCSLTLYFVDETFHSFQLFCLVLSSHMLIIAFFTESFFSRKSYQVNLAYFLWCLSLWGHREFSFPFI